MNKKRVINRISPLFLKGIAHRGLHNSDLTENGLLAFKNAIDQGFAFELDVHLTLDNKLIVCHDYDLKRTTGKDGIIEEMTLQEIKDKYLLLDGEKVPTLEDVLSLNQEKVPIVVELKVYKKNYKKLARETRKELKQIKNKKNIFIISFDPRALLKMTFTAFVRGLLVGTDDSGKLFWTYKLRFLFESVDLDATLLKFEEVQKYSRRHFINTWTIDSKEKFDSVYPFVDTTTFQLMDQDYVRNNLLMKNKKYL